ncbi:MAG: fatty acid desaturase [Pseudomonadota bacterium]
MPWHITTRIEWPTLWLILATWATWLLSTTVLAGHSVLLAVPVTAVVIALYSSLQHEVIHGHPTPWAGLNAALVAPALNLAIPFLRFRDTHIAHHRDALLTDPYDDPESNYLDAADWARLPLPVRGLMRANNTLLGRLAFGPIIAQYLFMASDLRAIRAGNRAVAAGWLWHIPAVAAVLIWVWASAMPVWAYVLSAYLAISILKIRTFAEHQAHELSRGRTVVIEDKGPLAFLFLNNNYHVVHHMHPRLPWYALPARFETARDRYLELNDGYRFGTYGDLFRRYFLRAKDPVAHPLWRRSNAPD